MGGSVPTALGGIPPKFITSTLFHFKGGYNLLLVVGCRWLDVVGIPLLDNAYHSVG